jgi:hypothetical protein
MPAAAFIPDPIVMLELFPTEQCEGCGRETQVDEGRTLEVLRNDTRGNIHPPRYELFLCGKCVQDPFIYGELVFECARCDVEHMRTAADGTDAVREIAGYDLCHRCARSSFVCQSCNELKDVYAAQFVERLGRVCDGCIESGGFMYCEECDCTYDEDEYYDSYYHDCRNGSDLVNCYSYRPVLGFRLVENGYGVTTHYPPPGTLFMGFELEVEVVDNIHDAAQQVLDAGEGLVYLKEDSSIDHGFEIVSHPFTIEWARAEFPRRLFDAVDRVREDGGDVGMHVHLSRSAFTRSHMWKFLRFHYDHPDEMVKLAGRTSHSWASFQPYWRHENQQKALVDYAYGPGGRVRKATDYHYHDWVSGRYEAVNTGNRDTIELRYWSSVSDKRVLMARFEFIHALYRWTKQLSAIEAKKRPEVMSWSAFTSWSMNGVAEDYPRLNEHLAELELV